MTTIKLHKNKSIYLKIIPVYILTLVTLTSSVYIFFSNDNKSYAFMFLMPVFYLFAYYLVFGDLVNRGFNLFHIVFILINFIRFVVGPVLIVSLNMYTGRSSQQPKESSFNLAFLLVIYEFVVIILVLKYLSNKNKENLYQREKKIIIPVKKTIYILFIIFSLLLLMINPNTINMYNFIFPNPNKIATTINPSTFEMLTNLSVTVSKQLIFILSVSFFYKRYIISYNFRWFVLSILALFFNIAIYSGENRSDFLMTVIASAFLFHKLYPKYSKFSSTFLLFGILFILPVITASRNMSGLISNDETWSNLSTMIQQYLGSPYNVAISVEAAELFSEHRSLGNLFYDLTRPVLGLNLFVSHLPFNLSTVYFNIRMYLRTNHTVQILPMIGQGYFYFGVFFAPLLSVIFIYLGDKLTKIMNKSNRIELIYFLAITSTRLAFSLGQNATIQMNDLSFNLFVPLLLMLLNDKFTIQKTGIGQI